MLISPYGGALVDLLVPAAERDDIREQAKRLPTIQLSERSLCDLELLATGAFSPVDRFMAAADHDRVLEEMRLASGVVFPMPIVLPVASLEGIRLDGDVTLTDQRRAPLAIMRVEAIDERAPAADAARICGTADPRHPLVGEMARWGRHTISGTLRVFATPIHYDFVPLRLTPFETRAR